MPEFIFLFVFFCFALQHDEGIEFCRQALEAGDDHPMAPRAHVALGIGYSLKAMDLKLKGDRKMLHNKALKAFQQ